MGNNNTKLVLPPSPRKKYGWRRDFCDLRDVKYRAKTYDNTQYYDTRSSCPVIYNQGRLGSCTANSIAFLYEFDEMKQREESIFTPSRLFIYYNERNIEHTTGYDSGASIRDGIKSINTIGVCPETAWTYDISKFTEKPPSSCYVEAEQHKSVQYSRVGQEKDDILSVLSEGNVIAFGFTVFESFESDSVKDNGIMKMPLPTEKSLGGHAVAIVGNINIENIDYFIIRNSWGAEWGDKGYFYMPYEFALNSEYCSDFWVVNVVRDGRLRRGDDS